MRFAMLTGLLMALCQATRADEPAPVYVFYGPSDRTEVSRWLDEYRAGGEDDRLLDDLLHAADFARSDDRADDLTMRALGHADLADFNVAVIEAWRCVGIPSPADGCRSVVVAGPDGIVIHRGSPRNVAIDGKLAAIAAKFFVDSQPIATVTLLKPDA
jgi:hypothetical protein